MTRRSFLNAAATVPANDIAIELYDPKCALKAHGDTTTSPSSSSQGPCLPCHPRAS